MSTGGTAGGFCPAENHVVVPAPYIPLTKITDRPKHLNRYSLYDLPSKRCIFTREANSVILVKEIAEFK